MNNFNTLSVDNKAVKVATLNGRVIYSALENIDYPTKEAEAAILSASTSLSTATYTCPNGVSYEYNQLSTFEENTFTGAGAGNVRPFAVSPYVMATAAHYGNTIQLGNMSIGDATVNRLSCVNLSTWAKEQGKWTDEYIDRLGLGDIELVVLDKTGNAVPTTSLPYFCSPLQYKALFHKDSYEGLVGWTSPQIEFDGTKQAAPIVVTGVTTDYELKWTIPALAMNLIDADLSAYYDVGNTYLAASGDSGRPVYFLYDGSPVVISHYHSVTVPSFGPTPPYYGVGPNYINGFDVLREFVKWYEGEDTLKKLPV